MCDFHIWNILSTCDHTSCAIICPSQFAARLIAVNLPAMALSGPTNEVVHLLLAQNIFPISGNCEQMSVFLSLCGSTLIVLKIYFVGRDFETDVLVLIEDKN